MPATSFDPIASPTVAVSPTREPQFVHDDEVAAATDPPRRVPRAHGPRPEPARHPHGRRRLGRLRLLRRRRRGRRADAEHRQARAAGPAHDVVLLGAVVHAEPGVAAHRAAADAPRPPPPADVRRARRAAGRGHPRRAPLRRRLRHPGGRQVAPRRERRVAAAERRLRRLLRLPLRVGHVQRVARPVLLPGGRLLARPAPTGWRTWRSTAPSCTPRGAARSSRWRR